MQVHHFGRQKAGGPLISVNIRKLLRFHWKNMAGFRRRGEFSSRSRFLLLAATSHAPLPKLLPEAPINSYEFAISIEH
jgi:hypothetical protein